MKKEREKGDEEDLAERRRRSGRLEGSDRRVRVGVRNRVVSVCLSKGEKRSIGYNVFCVRYKILEYLDEHCDYYEFHDFMTGGEE